MEITGGITLAKQWEWYLESAISKDAPLDQIIESKRIFYAGAFAHYKLTYNFSDDETLTENEIVELYQSLNKEIEDFFSSMMRGEN